jgi:hypothetical protein
VLVVIHNLPNITEQLIRCHKNLSAQIIINIFQVFIFERICELLPWLLGPTKTKTKLNSVVLVRKRTIPTERPPLVGVVSANFRG